MCLVGRICVAFGVPFLPGDYMFSVCNTVLFWCNVFYATLVRVNLKVKPRQVQVIRFYTKGQTVCPRLCLPLPSLPFPSLPLPSLTFLPHTRSFLPFPSLLLPSLTFHPHTQPILSFPSLTTTRPELVYVRLGRVMLS